MLTNEVLLAKLCRLAKKWNGRLIELSEEAYDHFGTKIIMQAPFSSHRLGVDWLEKTVYYSKPVYWYEVIHEMGHVFACKHVTEGADEWSFFGWEFAVVKWIGGSLVQWTKENGDYIVDGGRSLGNMNAEELTEMFKDRMVVARKNKLVIGRKPVAIR